MPWMPRAVARDLYTPDDRYGVADETIDRLGFWRSIIGLLTIIISTWQWRGIDSPLIAWDEVEEKAQKSVTLALIIVVVAFSIVFFATDPSRRRDLLLGTRKIALGGAVALAFVGIGLLNPEPSGRTAALLLPVLIYAGIFAIFMIYYGVRYAFAVGSAHSMLAPICSCALVFVTTAGDIAEHDTKGVPLAFWLFWTISGLASTWLLGTYELLALRSRGVRLFDGPVPHPRFEGP